MKDFKQATIYCSKKSYQQVKKIPNLLAFTKGILKDLLPSDIEDRIVFVEDVSQKYSDGIFEEKYDLFKDNSIMVYNLPGHAAGQIGIELETNKSKY